MQAGVDEAGRGPLAGPVAVAAVILDPDRDWSAIDDSKKLREADRNAMAAEIRAHALAWRVCLIPSQTIDAINILNATLHGMRRAVNELSLRPQRVLVDGNRVPDIDLPCLAIVGGDGLEKCIGAASILAKTSRDAHMLNLDATYPDYGFARHKGYPTPEHLSVLRRLGPTPEHRMSFAPVRRCLQADLFKPVGAA